MSTRRRGIVFIILGILFSLIAMVAVIALVSREPNTGTSISVPVLIAVSDLPAGQSMFDILNDEMIDVVSVSYNELPSDAIIINSMDELTVAQHIRVLLEQAVLIVPVPEGEIIQNNMLAWESNPVQNISPDKRAVAVAVDNVSSAGVILPGDHVDVIVSFSRDITKYDSETGLISDFQERVSQVLLQDIEVLEILERLPTDREQSLAIREGKEIASIVVAILALDLEEATKVSFMATYGDEVRLILRPPGVPVEPTPKPVTDETFSD